MALSRRAFLAGCAGCVAAPAARVNAQRRPPSDLSASVGFPDLARHWRGDSSVAAAMRTGQFFRAPSVRPTIGCGGTFDAERVGALVRSRFREPRRYFIFEYYPWYGVDPWVHWDLWDRRPPLDLAVTSVPLLGAYDSRAARVPGTARRVDCIQRSWRREPQLVGARQLQQWVDRDRAHWLAEQRIVESLHETLRLQTDLCLSNVRTGSLLVYINSFNEWHEGHQFEPAKSWRDLSPAERDLGYHNPADGNYRMRTLSHELGALLG